VGDSPNHGRAYYDVKYLEKYSDRYKNFPLDLPVGIKREKIEALAKKLGEKKDLDILFIKIKESTNKMI
jgi:hypothetical protein